MQQFDMFGTVIEAAPVENLPVMTASGWRSPESLAFDAALKRGALAEALAVVNRLSVKIAWKVLLESGFPVGGTKSRVELMAPAQKMIIEAAQRQMSGRELRDSAWPPSLAQLRFVEDVLDAKGGETFHSLSVLAGDQPLGHVDFSVYQEVPRVQMVEVAATMRRRGLGSQLLIELQRRYPDVEIELGGATNEGAALIAGLARVTVDSPLKEKFQALAVAENTLGEWKARVEEFDALEAPTVGQQLSHKNFLRSVMGQWNPLRDEIDDLRRELGDKKPALTLIKLDNRVKGVLSSDLMALALPVDMNGENHGGTTVQPGDVPGRNGAGNRNDGASNGVGSESVGDGLAGSGEGAVGEPGVSAGIDLPSGGGENGVGRGIESAASGAEGNSGDVRAAGRATLADADGGVGAGVGLTAGSAVVPGRDDVAVAGDYVITDEDRIGLGGLAEKFGDNLAAIDVVKALAAEHRLASPDERKVLARYVGWGGLKGVFDPDNKQWTRQHVALKGRLTDEEWAAASRSQLDAFYTPTVIGKAMYSAVERLGFAHGRILEPSVGVGNFIGLMPAAMREASTLHGVELDVLTSEMVAALYPSAQIAKATGFENYRVPAGHFDLVIGNPPFGSQPLVDEANSPYSGWSMHNYFFAKSIDMLRPGGVMTMEVSHSFLDKLDPHVRQWIARRAELVSGVRLPNTAFKEGANTEVVADVLIFRRLNERETLGRSEEPEWLNTREVPVVNRKTGETAMVTVNDYFALHPERVLGTAAAESSQFRANEYTVLPSGDLETQLADWVATLPEGIYVPQERSAAELELGAVAEIPGGVKEGSFFVQDGEVFQRLPDALGKTRAAPWVAANGMAKKRMIGMIGLREVLRLQLFLERTSSDEVTIETNRQALGQNYDAFLKDFGFLNDPVNRRLFIDDTESALVQALEFDYEKPITAAKAAEFGVEPRPARAVRADILSRRVLFPPLEVDSVDSAKDALLHSLNGSGRVDMPFMERVYGKSEADILAELGDIVFRDPDNGLVTADEYLSGDVKSKLAQAGRAAKGDPLFARNVVALEAVIPRDRLPSEIFASIGAAWVPPDVYESFAKEVSGASTSMAYVRATAQWLMSNTGGADYAKNSNEFGTDRISALGILTQMMNSRSVEIKKTIRVDGQDKYVTDEPATEAARQKVDKMRGHWDSWLWADGARAERLTHLFNERFNRVVERKFDGDHLSFPGMTPAITLLAHQKNGVWRGLQDRTMLLDQVVGAGKTYLMATLAMEMRRMGVAKKPLFVVPNHLTLQWRSDFYRLYPGANVLAATPQDFEKENRAKFFSKIVTGNWDAVVIGHSSLTKLGVPKDAEVAIIKEQFDDIVAGIEDMKRERGDRNIIRDMERIKTTLEGKLKTMEAKAGKKDAVVDFGDLGVDAIFVDELHEFKNLFFTTQMSRVAGLGNPLGSGKAFDLFVKTRWLKETFGKDAPLVGATGTPVSNSLAEMYTMQRYMQYDALKTDGLQHFDAWAKQYGDVQTVYEVAPSGTGYRLSQRFAKFKNLSSLMGAYRSFADVVTLDDLKAQELAQGKVFPVPKIQGGKPLNVVAQRSPLQTAFFGVPEVVRDKAGQPMFEIDLSKPVAIEKKDNDKWYLTTEHSVKSFDSEEEARFAVAAGATTPVMKVDPASIVGQFDNLRELTRQSKGKVNALSLTGLANKAGLDYRIIAPGAEDFPDSKINQGVRRMVDIHAKWVADKGVQLVFCDLSVPLSAKAKLASKEKRLFVRDEAGNVTHRMGTLHTVKEYEGLPYFLVPVGKGKDRSFAIFDPVTGQCMKEGLNSKSDAHAFVSDFVTKIGGSEQWLDMREMSRPIQAEEIDEYRDRKSMGEDGDEADLEISGQDIEGVSGVSGFSVYDDMRAKLIKSGVPPHEIEFIHDHDTPQAKDALFKRVNAGDVRFLFGSTPKMGAGTNVQKRLVALHHIDAPWRPSDLEQREGRIIRRGNLLYERDPERFEVEICRYATAQTYDTRRWQLLEHKAAGVDQLRKYSGESEIDDVASEAANSADMKAAASGNPLILRETQLAGEVRKLVFLERAHRDSEFMVRSRMNSNACYAEEFGPVALAGLQAMKAARDAVMVGQGSLGQLGGRLLESKEDVHKAIERIAMDMQEMNAKKALVYKGVRFDFERSWLGSVSWLTPDGHRTEIDKLSPSGMVTRMENWIEKIEDRIVDTQIRIDKSGQEAKALAGMLGKPFEQADELAQVIADHGKVRRALVKANSTAAIKPEEKAWFEEAVDRQRAALVKLGFGEAVAVLDQSVAELSVADGGVEQAPAGIPVVSTGIFVGEVLAVDKGFLVQATGAGEARVAHRVDRLTEMPGLGDRVQIGYAGLRAVVHGEAGRGGVGVAR